MTVMKLKGKAHKFGDNINAETIIPGSYKAGDIIAAGDNFGYGENSDETPLAIKSAGVSCVIAKSFAAMFYRNALNTGLPLFECPEASLAIKQGDTVTVMTAKGEISKANHKKIFKAVKLPDLLKQILASGGLMAYAAKEK